MVMNYHDRPKKKKRFFVPWRHCTHRRFLSLVVFVVFLTHQQIHRQHYHSSITTFSWNNVSEVFNSNPLSQELKTRANISCCSGHKYTGFMRTPPTGKSLGVKVTFWCYLTYDWITSHTFHMSVKIFTIKFPINTRSIFLITEDIILQQSYVFIVK